MEKSIDKDPPSKIEKKLESLVRKALYTFNMVESTPLAIALSGGKDSLTMLYMLKKISGLGFKKIPMKAIYVDGEFSCGPSVAKSHIETFCKELDIPLYTLQSKITKQSLNCYSCSRERRSLIFRKAKELGCKEIAFGHHKDDVLQTLLLNLFHKGEFAGQLAKIPMHDYGITIIRPLYYVLESQILTFAKQKDFFRLMCMCPVGATSKRNEVKEIIKDLEKKFPNIKTNLFLSLQESGSDKALKKHPLKIL